MRVVYGLDGIIGLIGTATAVVGFILCRHDRRFIVPAVLFFVGLMISIITVDFAADSTARFILFLAPLYVIAAACLNKLPQVVRLPVVIHVLVISAAAAAFFGAMFNLGYWLT